MPETGAQLNPAFAARLEKEIQEIKSILQNLKSLVPNLAAAMPITFDLPFFISGALPDGTVVNNNICSNGPC